MEFEDTQSLSPNAVLQSNWRELIKPKRLEVEEKSLTPTYGKFFGEPFERGYGTTIGNALRRVLLSSLQGAAIVAVRVLQLRWWGRGGGTAPAKSASTDAEREVLKGLGHRVRTARDFVRAVAELGGFLGRKCDAEPGWQTLWRGYRRLQDMVLGLQIKKGRVISDFRECHCMSLTPS